MLNGNVVIAVPCDTERARAIITRGRRIARCFGLEWIAIRIDRSRSETRSALAELVNSLGGALICAGARDIAAGLIAISRREHARVLVIGRSRRPRLLRRIKRGTTERILHAKRTFDVVVAVEEVER